MREDAIDATEFVLVTHWRIAAPRERVWDVLHDPTGWPRWWKYVASVEKLESGDAAGVGARYRFHWTSRLPYSLKLETRVVEVDKPNTIRAAAFGELDGEGTWHLREEGAVTAVEYVWRVKVTRAWMRLLAPLLRPAFAWNHNAVMAAGEEGLNKHLGRA